MQREGRKFESTYGYKYEFEKQEGENRINKLDFKENGFLRKVMSRYTRIMNGNM